MITPEMLRIDPLFSSLSKNELEAITIISKLVNYEAGEVIFKENQPADALYLLLKGAIDLFFTVEVEYHPELNKELLFGTVNPSELFSISAMIEPFILTSTARASKPSQVIRIDAIALRGICAEDRHLAYTLTSQLAKIAIERLNSTRLQLAMIHQSSPI